MDREQDQDVVVDERPGEPAAQPPVPDEAGGDTSPVRRPPLIELTTPSGRVWYIVNPN